MARQTSAPAPHPPMLFAFRGVQMFQLLLAIAALASGVGATFLVRAVTQGSGAWLLLPALFLGLVFLWLFGATLKAPTSLVAITDDRTRIRFANFVDTVIETKDVAGAKLVNRNILGGIGVRTNFSGNVALVTTWGPCVQLTLKQPLRVWLIPRIVPISARVLTLSVRHPAKLVERFGPPPTAPQPRIEGTRKMKRRGF